MSTRSSNARPAAARVMAGEVIAVTPPLMVAASAEAPARPAGDEAVERRSGSCPSPLGAAGKLSSRRVTALERPLAAPVVKSPSSRRGDLEVVGETRSECVSRRRARPTRRNRAVQDLYEPGSTFKVVTASAAIEEQVMPVDAPIDTSRGLHPDRLARRPLTTHNYGMLSFTDVHRQVEQRRRDQDRLQARHRAPERLRARGSASASAVVARFSRRERRHRLEAGASGPTARWRRCRWAIRSA